MQRNLLRAAGDGLPAGVPRGGGPCHDVQVSYFIGVLGHSGSGWRALDVDLEVAQTVDEMAEELRLAGDGAPVVAVIEHEDDWFALVRVDDGEDPRAFVSDREATGRSRYADLLTVVADASPPGPLTQEALAQEPLTPEPLTPEPLTPEPLTPEPLAPEPAEPGERVGSDDDGPPVPVVGLDEVLLAGADADLSAARLETPSWAGDPTLLADVGLSGEDLVKLVLASSGDPAQVLADVGERCGFDELLDSLR
jgi:putative tRNA adenosine deaminase-associated protein